MLNTLANLFGYLLNFIYNIFNNYGLAIILFSVLVKVAMLPLTIKQQKTMDKTAKLQEEIKALQFKYKNEPEMLNKELSSLYKRENMSPLSGCFSSIIQIILLLSVFFMVRSPLTFMKKVDISVINDYSSKISKESRYPEVEIIKEFGQEDKTVYLNMNFLGLDLANIPNFKDFSSMIIPVLYVISSIVSTKITMNSQKQQNKKQEDEKAEEEKQEETMPDMTKSMSYMMPIMAFSISLIAPLGLALYWLMNNILMIIERVSLNVLKKKKEENI